MRDRRVPPPAPVTMDRAEADVQTIEEQRIARENERAPDDAESDDASEDTLKPLGAEAPEIVERGARIGQRRLVRPLVGDAVTSLIGGMSVSFGAVAMAWGAASVGGGPGHLVGALLF